METYTKVFGVLTKHMVSVSLSMLMVLVMKVIGLMICSMGLAKSPGTKAEPPLLEISIKEGKMGKAVLTGKMDLIMRVILLMGTSKAMENTTSLT
jgi:hypothetical protein